MCSWHGRSLFSWKLIPQHYHRRIQIYSVSVYLAHIRFKNVMHYTMKFFSHFKSEYFSERDVISGKKNYPDLLSFVFLRELNHISCTWCRKISPEIAPIPTSIKWHDRARYARRIWSRRFGICTGRSPIIGDKWHFFAAEIEVGVISTSGLLWW